VLPAVRLLTAVAAIRGRFANRPYVQTAPTPRSSLKT
jgi:hypothetical protein